MGEREELAGIARSLKRKLERERAAGLGELLAEGAARAMRNDEAEAARTSEERAGAAGARDSVGPVASPRPTAAPPATLQPTSPRAPAAPAFNAVFRSPSPRSPGAPAFNAQDDVAERPDLDEPETAENLSLFGEPEAPARREARNAVVLPPVHGPLNPVDSAARQAILAEGWPVLEEVAALARSCTKCGLCETRTNAVPGVGNGSSGIVFVGEAPGADEDAQGEPFVGRAGQLLTKIIQAMDDARLIPGVPLNRGTVFICNVLKCRPPENRNPLPHEIESCSPYLRRQLEVLKPKIICCLGKFAAELLVGVKGTIGGLRGKVYRYQGAKLIVTYHPAACLRNPDYKRPVWEDMQLLAREHQSS